ncbi:hypothetical protein HYH03_014789 [Edaphochlamys debaryana]|uniref:NYN domain-containing protein n=1 Tax=Edaphochlamys debaryana TaxID=47281 RepID=A0A835XT84_9CHLO|nr:hypothetical protein HYH03_014789 [Edaphochlamys debaryana]|eukprot:KAG2486485.1 hypothetical protein HYH03_014789 [Edaphochlamys debaryana]
MGACASACGNGSDVASEHHLVTSKGKLGSERKTSGTKEQQLVVRRVSSRSAAKVGAAAQRGDIPPTIPRAPVDGRNLCVIIWDIENVRLPLPTSPALSPRHVIRYLKKHFIYGPGRTEYRTVAAVTERSLARIRRDHPGFVEQVVPDLTLLMASAVHAKRNADVVLKKELHQFVLEHAHTARACPGQLTIVLISGDEDFLEPVQGALQAGFSVQLVTHDTASGALLAQGYAGPPLLWSAFLRGCSGVQDLVLPYGDEQMHSVLTPRSLILAGFGPRRGGEAARDAAARLLRGALAAPGPAPGAPAPAGPPATPGTPGADGEGGAQGQGEAGALVLVEPSFGDLSGSCVVVANPRPGVDAGALARRLRWQQGGGGGPGGEGGPSPGPSGGGPNEPRLLVFEARRVVRLTLQADDAWVPTACGRGQGTSGGGDGEGEGDGGVEPRHASGSDAGAGPGAGPGPHALPHPSASGRGLHERLADASERLGALIRAYRLPATATAPASPLALSSVHAPHPPGPDSSTPPRRPGPGPGPHSHAASPYGAAAAGGGGGGGGGYGSAPPSQLQLLARFSRVPGPGELAAVLLLGCAGEGGDLLAALSHLRQLAGQLMALHGVALTAELMFSGTGAGVGAGAGAGGVVAVNGLGGSAGGVGLGTVVADGGVLAPLPGAGAGGGAGGEAGAAALRTLSLGPRRLPALPFRPGSFGGAEAQGGAAPPSQPQPQQEAGSEAGEQGPGQEEVYHSAHSDVADGAADVPTGARGGDWAQGPAGGGGKKKRKKRNKKRNKKNAVHPLPG